MAINSFAVFEIRPTGDNLNSGGFCPLATSPGTDRSQQDLPHVIIDGSTIVATQTGTSVLTLTGYTVTALDRGNVVRLIAGGGGSYNAGLYEITNVLVGGNTWTLDRQPGTIGATPLGRMGGCWATPQAQNDLNVTFTGAAAAKIWCKAAVYSLNVSINGNSSGKHFQGYGTVRGDNQSATMRATGTSLQMPNWEVLRNVILDFQTNAINTALTVLSIGKLAENILVLGNSNATGAGMATGGGHTKIRNVTVVSLATGFAGGSTTGGPILQCLAVGCQTGFSEIACTIVDCLAYNCTNGFVSGAGAFNGTFRHCTAYNCNLGFSFSADQITLVDWCLAYGCTTYGFSFAGVRQSCYVFNCAAGGNGTGNIFQTPFDNVNFIALSANPFVNAAGGDFSLNNSPGGGALLRSIGWQFRNLLTTTGYGTIGAVEPSTLGIPWATTGQLHP